MTTTLHVAFTTTYTGEPLTVIDGLPGGGAELRPNQLRVLAAALVRIAEDCDLRQAPKERSLPPVRVQYGIAIA